MFANMAQIVGQFKQSWSRELEDDAIVRACHEAGHTWRERQLGPVATVKLFLLQILFGNVACDWNAPDFCARGYESMGWVTGNRVSSSSSSSFRVCCWSAGAAGAEAAHAAANWAGVW